jgi:thiosulfate/3-mercaptopyruvate sulfurtransferase
LWVVVGVCVLLFSGRAMAIEWGTGELDTEKLAVKFSQEVAKGGYKVVTTEELKGWIDKKENMLIVDTMPFADSYKKNHIPGAVQIEFPIEELTQLDDKTKAEFEKLLGPDKARKIVFYCGFTKCGRSHNGAMWAMKLGYTNVYRYPGGIKAWMQADGKVDKVE